MNHKKIRNVVIFVFFVCLCIYAIHIYVSKSRIEDMQNVDLQNQYFDAEISIPRTIQLEQGELIELTFPLITLQGMEADNAEDRAKEKYYVLIEQGIVPSDAYGNADGTVTLVFDAENLELYIQMIENNFNSALGEGIDINKTFTHIVYKVDDDSQFIDYGFRLTAVYCLSVTAQILMGIPCHDWEIRLTTMYEPNGTVMFEHILNEENNIHISKEEWLEKLQEAQGK